MRGDAVASFEVGLGFVQLRLVGDVAHHTCLRASAEQSTLRTFQNLDALEVCGVDIEVAGRKLAGLVIEVDGDVGKPPDGTARLAAGGTDAQAAHVDVALARTVAGRRDVR